MSLEPGNMTGVIVVVASLALRLSSLCSILQAMKAGGVIEPETNAWFVAITAIFITRN